MRRLSPTLVIAITIVSAIAAQQTRPSNPQQPARDTSAPQNAPPPPAGRITGRVLAADNGRPIKRARVFATAVELPGGRGALTNESGVFELTEMPAGRYTITVSKSGFVSLSYGQRRPLQAGIPLQLADGQQMKGVDFRLPRGSAIAGRVLDEDGDVMPGVMVRVMRYQYLQGQRRLMPAGGGQTDDRGQYRVWGLMPGDYYVSAAARNFGPGAGRGGPGAAAFFDAFPGGFGARGGFFAGGQGQEDPDQLAYAPTYFPGVPSVEQARAVTVGLGEEVLDINFSMQLVRAARIAGHVTNPDGTPSTSGSVNLASDSAAGRAGAAFGTRIQWDGAFTLANVPPGRYILRARADDDDTPQYASQPLTVSGQDVPDLTIVVSAGASISGTITFLPGSTTAPDLTQVRIVAPSLDDTGFGPQPNARVAKDGTFSLTGVPAGSHFVRPNGNPRGWTLKSVSVAGRDVTDTPITLRSGESLANVDVVFTDKLSEINGTITDQQGTPIADYTVLAFSTDPSLWRAQSRQIMTARPDQTGQYKIRGLPPGEYFVVTVDPAEQGEWFEPTYLDEHKAGAQRVRISEGDVKTQDFKVKT